MKISLNQDRTKVSMIYVGSLDKYEGSSLSHGSKAIYVSPNGKYENIVVFEGQEPWMSKLHFLACQDTKVDLIFAKNYAASMSEKKLLVWDHQLAPPKDIDLHDAGWVFYFEEKAVIVDCFSIYVIDPITLDIQVDHYSDVITDVTIEEGKLRVHLMSGKTDEFLKRMYRQEGLIE